MKPRRGEIYFAKLEDGIGSVVGRDRPVVIVSNNKGNCASTICMVVPLKVSSRKSLPTHATVFAGLNSVALCENIITVSQHCLERKIGTCTQSEMKQIDNALVVAFGLEDAWNS